MRGRWIWHQYDLNPQGDLVKREQIREMGILACRGSTYSAKFFVIK